MPNQINTESIVNLESQSKEKIQTWIKVMSDDRSYCWSMHMPCGLVQPFISKLFAPLIL